jgi:hypothetical protein
MLKRLVLVFVVYAILPVNVQAGATRTDKNGNAAEKIQQPVPPITVTVVNQPASQGQQDAAQPHTDSYLHHLLLPETLASIGLLVLGALTLIWFIKQTKATQKSAEAALANAQAVINAERAWLVVKIEKGNSPRFPIENFMNVLTNVGRTPAVLISVHIQYTFVSLPDDLPVPPVYGPRWSVPIPEKTFVVSQSDLPIGPGMNPKKDIFMHHPKPPQAEAEDAHEFLVWFGRIVYEDVFVSQGSTIREPHETRWCFAWIEGEDRFVRCGPGEYNRNT